MVYLLRVLIYVELIFDDGNVGRTLVVDTNFWRKVDISCYLILVMKTGVGDVWVFMMSSWILVNCSCVVPVVGKV